MLDQGTTVTIRASSPTPSSRSTVSPACSARTTALCAHELIAVAHPIPRAGRQAEADYSGSGSAGAPAASIALGVSKSGG
ncbi:MAG: hypothetical protein U0531_06660 [Dehalococcoidia bacterium]